VIGFRIRFLYRKTIARLQGQGVSYRLPTFSGFKPPHNVASVLLGAQWSLIIIVPARKSTLLLKISKVGIAQS
jgi:hypothetical protein